MEQLMNTSDFTEAYRELNHQIFNLLDSFSALSVLSSLDLRATDELHILRKALAALTDNLDIERSSIFLIREGKLMNCISLTWDDAPLVDPQLPRISRKSQDFAIPMEGGIMGLAMRRKTLQHCQDCSLVCGLAMPPGQETGSLICAPIFQAGGDVLGVLNISHPTPYFFNEWHERFLVVYCNCLGQLLTNSRLVNHMESEIEKHTSSLRRALEVSKENEQGLRLFKTIIESLQESVSINGADGALLYTNPAFEKLFGYPTGNKRLMNMNICYEEDSLAMLNQQVFPSLAKEGTWEGELTAIDSEGRGFPVWTFVDAVREEEGKVVFFYTFTRDLRRIKEAEEERKRLEAQLHQAQKMEAVGQLAGGVAHDFNNVITAIIGYAYLLLTKTDQNDPSRRIIEQIIAASERAADVTRGLLAFSRKQVINLQPVDVKTVLKKMEGLLSRLIGEDIEITTDISNEKLFVMADSGQLEQVLMNLATNSRDAMANGGEISIKAERRQTGNEFINPSGNRISGEYVCISVTDNGTGMDAHTRERMFDPFFTTKEVGKGTGLGLAIVYGIVKELNGHITCQSEIGKGTEFTIYLPVLEADNIRKEKKSGPPPKACRKTILIAEDDAQVRETSAALLQKTGYGVVEATDGEDAIAKFMKENDHLDLVILDVVMPKKNGKEVFDCIKKVRPDMKVLFTSGYTADIINDKGIIERHQDFLAKPHFPEELLKRVQDILHEKRSAFTEAKETITEEGISPAML
jgi:PAS domain S-box-containing protein